MFIFTTTILQKLKDKNPTLENPSAKVKSTSDQWHGLKMCKHGWHMVFKAELVSVTWELGYGTILPFVTALTELKASGSFPTLSASHPMVTLLHATGMLPTMVWRWEDCLNDGWDGNSVMAAQILYSSSLILMIKTRKNYGNLKKNLSDWCISFVSEVPGCVVLGEQASWVDLKGLCLWDIDRGTWRTAAEGLGWPSLQWMLRKTFHLALGWVTQRFAIASFFQTKHLGLSY